MKITKEYWKFKEKCIKEDDELNPHWDGLQIMFLAQKIDELLLKGEKK